MSLQDVLNSTVYYTSGSQWDIDTDNNPIVALSGSQLSTFEGHGPVVPRRTAVEDPERSSKLVTEDRGTNSSRWPQQALV